MNKEDVFDEIYELMIKQRIDSKAVSFGYPDKGISRQEMKESTVFEIENYARSKENPNGFNIKVLIKNN